MYGFVESLTPMDLFGPDDPINDLCSYLPGGGESPPLPSEFTSSLEPCLYWKAGYLGLTRDDELLYWPGAGVLKA